MDGHRHNRLIKLLAILKIQVEAVDRLFPISSIDLKAQIIMDTEEREGREWVWMDQIEYGNIIKTEAKMI